VDAHWKEWHEDEKKGLTVRLFVFPDGGENTELNIAQLKIHSSIRK
jgi:hypothetical protein